MSARWTLDVHEVDSCTSTQNAAAERARTAGPGVATLLVAREQLAGRGREGRRWMQPPGLALQCSLHVPGPITAERAAALTAQATTLVLESVRHELGEEAATALRAQAPNDIYADEGKVGGVLIDARWVGDCAEAITFGVGLNLNGAAFQVDGRTASTVEAASGVASPDGAPMRLARRLAGVLLELLS